MLPAAAHVTSKQALSAMTESPPEEMPASIEIALNVERINARHAEIDQALARYAPRDNGEDECDARTFLTALAAVGEPVAAS